MNKSSKSYEAYFQVAVPSEGGTIPAGKDPLNCDDALGNPGRFTRNEQTTTPQSDAKTQKLIDDQVGTNMTLTWTRTKES